MRSGTLRESGPAQQGSVHLLTLVLSFDDLLCPVTQSFQLLSAIKTVRIGRAPDASPSGWQGMSDLHIRDPFLSTRHAVLERRADGFALRDERSANGTFVQGEPINGGDGGGGGGRMLCDGDLLVMGHSLLVYRVVEQRKFELMAARDETSPKLGPVATFCPDVAVLLADLARIAPSREPVLILGETGAGKEHASSLVHALSGRSGPLRAVDCGAVPENLFESIFFGHVRGSFTGAASSHVGELVRADRGTLFLDEVGNLTPGSQAKLLRVLETGLVTPVGATDPQRVDVRVVAATNRDLFADPSFRPDLLRRLASFVGRLPPLRQRREDLGVLSAFLLREAGATKAAITTAAGQRLFSGRFPGNVRELGATLRSAALLAGSDRIDVSHLPPPSPEPLPADGPDSKRGIERAMPKTAADVEALLRAHGGNVSRAAEAIGISRRQLHRWLKRMAISPESLRGDADDQSAESLSGEDSLDGSDPGFAPPSDREEPRH